MTDAPAAPDDRGTDPNDPNRYNVNFFRSRSAYTRANARLITVLFLIWAIAVFGFQILLMVMNKETPEETLGQFEAVWGNVESGSASTEEKQEFAKSVLAVLGKNIALQPEHKAALQSSLSGTVLGLLPDSEKSDYSAALEEAADTVAPNAVVEAAANAIGLGEEGFEPVMRDLLPSSLIMVEDASPDPALPEIMSLYLVHNQSALTNARFLGFPFHYWYTAQFLLILFVVLCLVYAMITDRVNKAQGFEDK